ncbi:unnamed protein product [Lactuca virosa]|uniref:Uncharacterized protein n=1 Tax=Lactuca virosa TaxID=75947 RepID=A0AAU9PJV5_9ASTR|nr:unnamed protein product [Lactuca virosa]
MSVNVGCIVTVMELVDDNLQYRCATCCGECYQVRDLEDAVQELWRRRDKADRELTASLRAAAGLPFYARYLALLKEEKELYAKIIEVLKIGGLYHLYLDIRFPPPDFLILSSRLSLQKVYSSIRDGTEIQKIGVRIQEIDEEVGKCSISKRDERCFLLIIKEIKDDWE